MARLWSTGFETNTTTAWVEFSGGLSGTGSISTTQKNGGSYSFRSNPTTATGYISHTFKQTSNSNRYYFRTYIYIATAPSAATYILSVTSSGAGTGLRLNTDRTVTLLNQSGTALGSNSTAIPLNQWHYLEIDIQSAAATSAKLDGTQFASATNASMPSWDTVFVGVMSTCTADVYFDDVAVNDTTGTVQNAYPGAGKITHLHPGSAGASNALLKSTGTAGTTTNYTDMNEVTPNDATTYLKTTAIADDGKTDSYNVESSATGGMSSADTVTLVSWRGRYMFPYSNTWAGFIGRIRYSATNTDTGTINIDTANAWRTFAQGTATGAVKGVEILQTYVAPGGAAWTPTILGSTEVAIVSKTNTFANTNQFSNLYLLVEYVPSAGTVFTKTQTATAKIVQSFTKTQPATARIAKNFTKTQTAIAKIRGPKEYYRDNLTTLPTTAGALATAYTATDITNVATVDSVFVDVTGFNAYLLHEFVNFNATQQIITPTWTGKSAQSAVTSPVYLQIYNFTTPAWETLASNSAASAGTAFTLTASQSTSLANYYDANGYCWVRVYQ
jgi:hypothetical protein